MTETPFITSDIRYIGQDDAEIRLFESQYVVPEGMCYNSYLIMDEHIAIMDTSDNRTMDLWKRDLKEALGGKTPEYLVVHHLEPDHASGIGEAVAMYPEIKVVCSVKAAQMMPQYFCNVQPSKLMTMKEGDTLSLGRHQLVFTLAPMVHWPEVMMTYDATDKVLFSADGFGKFGVMEADANDWAREARRYYWNICGKYGTPIANVLKKASALDIEQVLPLHGPILKGEKLAEALRLYGLWSHYEVEEAEGVFVAYASIHGCTKEAALKLVEILKEKGCPKVEIADLSVEDQATCISNAFRYGKMVLAASSYDAGLFPPMYDFLHHLLIKTWQNRKVALIENGSWAPSAGKTMLKLIEEMKGIEVKGELLTLRGRMKDEDVAKLETLAENLLNG